MVGQSVPTKVVALTPDVADASMRLTAERLREIGRLTGAALVRPHVELTVRLSLDGGGPTTVDVTAEGVLADEPAVSGAALAGGGGLVTGDRQVVLPPGALRKLGGDPDAAASVTLQISRTVDGRDEVCRVPLRVAGVLRDDGTDDRAFVPLALAESLDLWATDKTAGLGDDATPRPAYAPADVWVPTVLAARAADEAAAMHVRLVPDGEPVEVADVAGPVLARLVGTDAKPAVSKAVMAFAAAVPGATTRPAATRPATGPTTRTASSADGSPLLRFADAAAYLQARRRVAAAGQSLVPATAVPVQRWARFKVQDERTADEHVDRSLVGLLAMSRPTFVACRGHQAMTVEVASTGRSIELVGSAADDPARFGTPLAGGRWLAGDGRDEVVVPAGWAEVGRTVAVRVGRDTAARAGGALTIRLRVVGVTADGDGPAYVSQSLADDLALWRAGKLTYNDARGTFRSPAEVARSAGHVRAAVYAVDVESLPGVVRTLQDLGYRTQDHLAEQQGLRRLQQAVFLIGGGAVGGCLLLSAAFVGLGTALNYQAKGYEIAVLRAHGVGPADILRIFGVQGLAIGVAAIVVAAATAGAVEPVVTGVLSRAVSASAAEVFRGSPLLPSLWWLWLTAGGICVAFSLGGVLAPGRRACRGPLLGGMRRRD